MTSKEKAFDIVDKIMQYTPVNYPNNCTEEEANEIVLAGLNIAEEIAKVVVSEIIIALKDYGEQELQNMDSEFRYWDEVYEAVSTNKN